MAGFRFGVFAQLITSFVLAVVFTISAAIIGIVSIQQFHEGIEEVALSKLPAMTLAYQLGQQSEAIVASAPMLLRSRTQAQRETISFRIADRVRWLQEIVDSLKTYEIDQEVLASIQVTHSQLLANYASLDALMRERIDNFSMLEARTQQLHNLYRLKDQDVSALNQEWQEKLETLIESVLVYETETQESRVETYKLGILDAFEKLDRHMPEIEASGMWGHYDLLRNVVLGETGLIKLRAQQQLTDQKIAGILALNERLSSRFVYSVNDLIRRMRTEVEAESQNFQKIVGSRTNLLTLLVLGSMFVLVVIGVFVLRRILTRLNDLKVSMRTHAQGGKTQIPQDGNDELADMGRALHYLVEEINRRESEILMNEERFRDMADATSDWFFETDEQLRVIMTSERFFEITGFDRMRFIGRVTLPLAGQDKGYSHYENQESWIRYNNDLQNRRRFRDFVFSLKCPDGFWRQIKVSGKPIFDENGTFTGYRGTGSDISAESQARSRLTAANEIMPGAFALWDRDNRLVMCNRKFHQFYKQVDDRIRTGVLFEDLVNELERRQSIRDNAGYAERRAAFRKNPIGVFMEPLANGRYLQVSEAPTLDGGVVSLVVDITDRIEAESRLEEARLESENANKAKSKFLAAASHDLRQPLHAIGMFLSALEDRRSKVANENARGDLHIINNISDSLEALRGLLNALLDISKLDAGVMKAEPATFNLQPLLKRLVRQFDGRAREKGLKLKSFCPPVAVKSDPVLLERVLSNLMSNAIRYTQDGGVLVGVRQGGSEIVIQVVDSGVGIPKERLNDIFIEFQQLDNPARDRRRGLGLGLAIVERVIALLNHTLNLKSVVGKGSVFSVCLPRGHSNDIVEIEEEVSEIETGGEDASLIVVVDDEPDILEGMSHLIRGWKYDVLAAGSTADALAQLDETDSKPMLILADYRLQEELSGADCIRMLHEKIGEKTPAAIITGDTAPDRIQEAKSSGFILLHKPLRPAKLRQLIRNIEVNAFRGPSK